MMEEESETYSLFISQLDETTYEYDRLIGKLSSVENFKFEDHSVPGKTSREELEDQMDDVDVVVILSGLYSADKNLIEREIDVAKTLQKPIIIVRPYGMENVPGKIEEAANEVIGWNAGCIIDSITETLEEEEDDY